MGFGKETKEQALVASARHCCVCHKYKGLKVEVHHIIPQHKGGANSYDNAIALCFDCHCDAGHYNDQHPRGIKFSPNELRKHRDSWYELVRENRIEPADQNQLHTRYLMCEDLDAVKEVLSGDFSNFPIKDLYLVSNNVSIFFQRLVELQKFRVKAIPYREFETYEDYKQSEPNHSLIPNDDDNFPCYQTTRNIKPDEINEIIDQLDCISNHLVKTKQITLEKMIKILGYLERCATSRYCENINVRPLYFTFLCVTNMSEELVTFKHIDGLGNNSKSNSVSLPQAPIQPGSSILIPLHALLSNHPGVDIMDSTLISSSSTASAQEQEMKHVTIKDQDLITLTPNFIPQNIAFSISNINFQEAVHDFDPSNLYIINRYWRAGSCPHIFFKSKDLWTYNGELFNEANTWSIKRLLIPTDVSKVIIAEIEDEETHIEYIKQADKFLCTNITIKKGDHINIPVESNQFIEIKGMYKLADHALEVTDNWLKNYRVKERLRTQNKNEEIYVRSVI